MAAAAIIMLFSAAKSLIKFAPYIALAGFAASIVLAVMQWGMVTTGFAAMVTVDKFGVIFKLIFLVASTLSLFMAYRYLQVKGIHKPEFYCAVAGLDHRHDGDGQYDRPDRPVPRS